MAISTVGTNNTIFSPSANTSSSSTSSSSTKKSTLDFEGFLKIMAAQMQNQSITSDSGTDNSQYVTEMALFSAIQAMNTQTAEASKQYAASLVGSNVLVSTVDSSGNTKKIEGTVSKAIFNSSTDENTIQIGSQTYDLSDVIQVLGYQSTNDTSTRQYAASLVGKNVVVQTTDSSTGVTSKVTGKVQSVTFDSSTDSATLTIGDKTYSVSDVIQVLGDSSTSGSSTSESSESGT